MAEPVKDSKKIINAWCMYDWANSVYSLVITSTIFPVYYNNVTQSASGGDMVEFFGLSIENTVLYSYSISFSFVIIAAIAPFLSGIADYSGRKKLFMQFFAYMGAVSCMFLYFFDGNSVEYGIFWSVMASIGFSGSLVFYNAFLPEITIPQKFDVVSAKGFSLGYTGSIILLLVNLLMMEFPESFFLGGRGDAARISFVMVGIWWIGFGQIPFYYLPKNVFNRKIRGKVWVKGYHELLKVWHSLVDFPHLKRFLYAFLFYSMGVQTVMLLAASFGSKVLNLEAGKLIMTIMIIQIVGVAGAYFFAFISKLYGNKFSLATMVTIWMGICFVAFFITGEYQFYGLAFAVGLVMGGIQSLSRSTYSKLIPAGTIDHASFFSFYDVTEKISIVLGTLSFGLIEQWTGAMRNSTLVLALFFVIGFVLLMRVSIPRREYEVKSEK